MKDEAAVTGVHGPKDEWLEVRLERRKVCRTHNDLVVYETGMLPYCRQWHHREQGECVIEEIWMEVDHERQE